MDAASAMLTTLPDARAPLDAAAAGNAFDAVLDGRIDDDGIAAFLCALADRGATAVEVAAAAQAMRQRMRTLAAPEGSIDVCGTGGDGRATWNISTAVAIVVAACGVPVAKHGNRAASSRSGAADVLELLGIPLDQPVDRIEEQLQRLGIAFLFAGHHHPALARLAPIRRALARPTIFNMLGPLCNPAGVTRQMIGVGDPSWAPVIADAARALGSARCFVVHGADGLDELTVTRESLLIDVAPTGTTSVQLRAPEAGVAEHAASALVGGTPAENAAALLALLDGARGAYRDIVLLNSAAALLLAGRCATLRDGAACAADAIDAGAARDLLERWRHFR